MGKFRKGGFNLMPLKTRVVHQDAEALAGIGRVFQRPAKASTTCFVIS